MDRRKMKRKGTEDSGGWFANYEDLEGSRRTRRGQLE